MINETPAPWCGLDHGKQWPLWIGTLALGVVLMIVGADADGPNSAAGGAAMLGAILLIGTNLAGMFVMGRRLARRKGRSVGLATVMTLIFGWFAVLVYACMKTPYREMSFAEEEAIFASLQRQRGRG